MRTARAITVTGLLFLPLAATSCDELGEAADNKMGIGLDDLGRPVIMVMPCEDETVRRVSMVDPASLTDDGSTPLTYLWRVATPNLEPGEAVSIPIDDSPPEGMHLDDPLAIDLSSPTTYVLAGYSSVEAGHSSGSARDFLMEDLEPGIILTRSDRVTMEEYVDVARGACG